MADENPDNFLDSIGKLEERKEYLEEWKRRHLEEQKVARQIQEDLDRTNWQLNALKERPEEASEIPFPLALEPKRLEQENLYTYEALPLPPEYNMVRFYNSTTFSTSGSAVVFEYVYRVGDIDTDAARGYSHKYITEYLDLQKEQQRPQQVKKLLERLGSPGLIERFKIAITSYQDYKIDPVTRKATAGEIRTFLWGSQGVLFDRARKWPKENMTWDEMAKRLANDVGIAYQRLLEEEPKFSSLIEQLSSVLKDREGGSITNLELIWSNMLDHIYTVLSLIRME